jgi:hypothetical protein
MNYLLSLERWDRGFESHLRHGCLCIGSDLATGWSPVQGVLPTLFMIKKLKSGQYPTKGSRAIDRWFERLCWNCLLCYVVSYMGVPRLPVVAPSLLFCLYLFEIGKNSEFWMQTIFVPRLTQFVREELVWVSNMVLEPFLFVHWSVSRQVLHATVEFNWNMDQWENTVSTHAFGFANVTTHNLYLTYNNKTRTKALKRKLVEIYRRWFVPCIADS